MHLSTDLKCSLHQGELLEICTQLSCKQSSLVCAQCRTSFHQSHAQKLVRISQLPESIAQLKFDLVKNQKQQIEDREVEFFLEQMQSRHISQIINQQKLQGLATHIKNLQYHYYNKSQNLIRQLTKYSPEINRNRADYETISNWFRKRDLIEQFNQSITSILVNMSNLIFMCGQSYEKHSLISKFYELIKQGNDAYAFGKTSESLNKYDEAMQLRPNSVFAYYKIAHDLLVNQIPAEAHEYHQKGEELELHLMISIRSQGQGSQYLVAAYENLKDNCRPFFNGIDGLGGGRGLELDLALQQAQLNGQVPRDRQLAAEGDMLNNSHHFQQAIQNYNQAIQINPNVPGYYMSKANSLINLSRFQEALTCLQMVESLDPTFKNLQLRKGITLEKLHQIPDALRAYDLGLRAAPFDSELITRKGVCYHNSHQYELAVFQFYIALLLTPHDDSVLYNLGFALHLLNKQEEAIQQFDKAISLDRSNGIYYYRKGLCLEKLGRREEAILVFIEASKRQIADPIIYLRIGHSLKNARKYDEALKAFAKFEQTDPFLEQLLIQKASTLNKLERYEEAKVILQNLLQSKPNCARVYYQLGYSEFRNQNFEEAQLLLEQASDLKPAKQKYKLLRGMVLHQARKYDDAISQYQSVTGLISQDQKNALIDKAKQKVPLHPSQYI